MKAFLKKIGDMFLDQAGGVDEKRVIGMILFLCAIVYLWTHDAKTETWVTVGGLLTFCFGALGIAAAADQGKLGGP